jgi:hypothetical protein
MTKALPSPRDESATRTLPRYHPSKRYRSLDQVRSDVGTGRYLRPANGGRARPSLLIDPRATFGWRLREDFRCAFRVRLPPQGRTLWTFHHAYSFPSQPVCYLAERQAVQSLPAPQLKTETPNELPFLCDAIILEKREKGKRRGDEMNDALVSAGAPRPPTIRSRLSPHGDGVAAVGTGVGVGWMSK